MKNSSLVLVSSISTAFLIATAAVALADDSDGTNPPMPPVHHALELALATGYTQGVGDIYGGDGAQTLDDVSGVGASVEAQIGYRLTPHYTIGAYGSLATYDEGNLGAKTNEGITGLTAGLKSDWHFSPATKIDPWVSVGGGIRWMKFEDSAMPDRKLLALDLVRLQAGLDYRLTPAFSIGPVMGLTASQFVSENNGMPGGWNEISDRGVSLHFQAGVIGRFDTPLGK